MNDKKLTDRPVYFWRRLAAYFLDWSIVALITLVIYLPIMALDEQQEYRISTSPIYFKQTYTNEFPANSHYAKYLPELEGYKKQVSITRKFAWFFIPNGRYVDLMSHKEGKPWLSASVAIDRGGNPIHEKSFDWIIFFAIWVFVMPAVFAKNSAGWGKRMLSLEMRAVDPNARTYGKLVKRELIRSLPLYPILSIVFLGRLVVADKPIEEVLLERKKAFEDYVQTGDLQSLSIAGTSWLNYLIGAAAILTVVWFIVIVIYVLRKKNRMPWDIIAQTEVGKVASS